MSRKDHESRFASLKRDRDTWLPHWRELSESFLPWRGKALWPNQQANRGSKRNQKLINSTPRFAVRTLSSGMMAGLTSPARPWFQLSTPDPGMKEIPGVREWLFAVQTRMLDVFAKSNFYQGLYIGYASLATFGTHAQVILDDREDVIRVYPFDTGSYCLANSPRLNVNTLYREFQMTVKQLVETFGRERVSQQVGNLYDTKKFDEWFWVVHAILPNMDRQPGLVDSPNMPISSVYYERDSSNVEFLSQKGFEEDPGQYPRWEVTGEDIYGSSPAMDVLGDAKSLQLQEKRKAQAIDKHVDPPMVATPDLKNQRTSLLPGDVTYTSFSNTGGAPGFQPAYHIKPEITALLDDINSSENRIRRGLYEDLFLMLTMSDRREITAREIEERHEEKLLMLGPVLERLNDELLDPAIDRTFSIMLRRGLIPPPPRELQDSELKVEYVSVLAQAQRAVATSGIERMTAFVGTIAPVHPEVMDTVDFDQAVAEYGEAVGVSPRIVRSKESLAQLRAERAQQQQMMQMAAAAQPAAQVAKGVKDLSEARVGGQSALEAVAS